MPMSEGNLDTRVDTLYIIRNTERLARLSSIFSAALVEKGNPRLRNWVAKISQHVIVLLRADNIGA